MDIKELVRKCLKPIEGDIRITEGAIDTSESQQAESRAFWTTALSMNFSLDFFTYNQVRRIMPKGIIDLGCGNMDLLRGIRRHRMITPYVGIDIRVQNTGDKDARFLQCNFSDHWPLRKSSVPCIVFQEVLEHMTREEGDRVLKRIARSLEPGGSLILTTPLETGRRNMERDLKRYGHLYYWSQEELEGRLNDLNLVPEVAFRTRFLGDRISEEEVRKACLDTYAHDGFLDPLFIRFGSQVVGAMFSHLVPDNKVTGYQAVWRQQ